MLAILIAVPSPTQAHGPDGGFDAFSFPETMAVLRLGIERAPEILAEDDGHASVVPVLTIRGQRMKLNSAFWEVASAWTRLFYSEMERDCPGCSGFTLEQLDQVVRDRVARGFMRTQILDPIANRGTQIASMVVDTSAQQGPTAGVAIGVGEIVEDAMLWAFAAWNVHFLCNLIQATVLYWNSTVTSTFRTLTMSPSLGVSRTRSFFQQAMLASSIQRAQRRVQFETGPIEIDEAEIGEVDEEGPRRFFGLLKEGKRGTWLRRLVDRSQPLVGELAEIESRLENEPENESLLERREQIISRLGRTTELNVRNYFGARYKRFAFIFSRKVTSTHLRGRGAVEERLNKGGLLWIMNVQEGILHRGLLQAENPYEGALEVLNRSHRRAPADEIRAGLALESAQGNEALAENFERILSDVGAIFDPLVSKERKALIIAIMENVLNSLYFRLTSDEVFQTRAYRTLGFFEMVSFRTTVGRYHYRVQEFIDFLRIAGVSRNAQVLEDHKHEAMEMTLEMLGNVHILEEMSHAFSRDQLRELQTKLADLNRRLRDSRSWREKRTTYSFIPFRNPVPRCEDLARQI